MSGVAQHRPYIWHADVWQHVLGLQRQGKLPHALMVAGPDGVGKHAFSLALVQWVLCHQPAGDFACGRCKSCLLWQAGSHPDYVTLEPEVDPKTGKVSRVIKVDQVREVIDFSVKTAQLGGYRVIVLTPADVLNMQAANALLKTLEEPAGKTLFLLITDSMLSLLPTIRSRCQQVRLDLPSSEQAMHWLTPLMGGDNKVAALLLRLARGAPLTALALRDGGWFGEREALLKDMVQVAEGTSAAMACSSRWQRMQPEQFLTALGSLVEDSIFVALGQGAAVKSQDLLPALQRLSQRVPAPAGLRFLEMVNDALRLVAANISPQSLIDNLWLEWSRPGA